jgi:hypothetical protein
VGTTTVGAVPDVPDGERSEEGIVTVFVEPVLQGPLDWVAFGVPLGELPHEASASASRDPVATSRIDPLEARMTRQPIFSSHFL